jgi:hypothetical protein
MTKRKKLSESPLPMQSTKGSPIEDYFKNHPDRREDLAGYLLQLQNAGVKVGAGTIREAFIETYGDDLPGSVSTFRRFLRVHMNWR